MKESSGISPSRNFSAIFCQIWNNLLENGVLQENLNVLYPKNSIILPVIFQFAYGR